MFSFKNALCLLFLFLNTSYTLYLTLATSNYPPLVICDQGTKMSSQSDISFSGLEIDIIKKVLSRMGYKSSDFEINCIDPDNFQTFLDTNQFSGYFSHETFENVLLDKNYSFSVSIFDTGLNILAAAKEDNISYRFLVIFDPGLWIIICLAVLLIAHLIWMIEKSSKGEIKNDYVQGINNSLWNTITAFFFANDIKIKTFAGRIIYAVFLFMILVLKAVFLAEFISDYNRRSFSSSYGYITDYANTDSIGTFPEYSEKVSIYNQNSVVLKIYQTNETNLMVNDLNNGNIDGIVMDAYLSLYQELQSSCSLKTIGTIFYYFSYPIIMSPDFDQTFLQKLNIEILNIKLSIENENLINKYFYSNSSNCLFNSNSFAPIDFTYLFGAFIIFIGFVGFSLLTLAIKKYYANKHRLLEYKQMLSIKGQQFLKKNNSNKDMNMLLKFDKILSASEKKFKQRLKDLQCVLQQTITSFLNFKEILFDLEKNLEKIENEKIVDSKSGTINYIN